MVVSTTNQNLDTLNVAPSDYLSSENGGLKIKANDFDAKSELERVFRDL